MFGEAYGLTRDLRCRSAALAVLARLDPSDPQTGVTHAIARLSGIAADPESIPVARRAGLAPTVPEALVQLLSGQAPWEDDSLRKTCEGLADLRPDDALSLHDIALAAFQAGGEISRATNEKMKQRLADRCDGFAADPPSVAALHTATLAVYYRYARLLRRD